MQKLLHFSLVELILRKGYGYRLKYLVIDFLKGKDLQYYFIGLKSFLLDEDNYKVISSGLV